MNYREIEWCGYHWRTEERWGDRHPDQPKLVRDGNMVKENEDGSIALFITKNDDGDYSAGLLSMIEPLGYGTYFLEVKLPEGDNLWPAFWCWSYDSWPPEIDFFEGYSGTSDYRENALMRRVCPNVHYGDDNASHSSVGARNVTSFACNPDKWIEVKCKYTKKHISIYYNGVLVYYVRSKKVMQWFRDHEMQNVIINTGVSPRFSDEDVETLGMPMVVKNFKYEKI